MSLCLASRSNNFYNISNTYLKAYSAHYGEPCTQNVQFRTFPILKLLQTVRKRTTILTCVVLVMNLHRIYLESWRVEGSCDRVSDIIIIISLSSSSLNLIIFKCILDRLKIAFVVVRCEHILPVKCRTFVESRGKRCPL